MISNSGASSFQTGGLTSLTNTGSIQIDGSLLDTGNGSGDFFLHFVDLSATPVQSDFDDQELTLVNSASGVIFLGQLRDRCGGIGYGRGRQWPGGQRGYASQPG